MKLSIIIPYFNGERWISKCLDSLLQQEMNDDEYEIIVVDDGSTHDVDTLMKYAQNYSQVKYVRQENAGQGAARNRGLRMAHGDYVFFCDCDDFLKKHVLGHLCHLAIQNDLDVLEHCCQKIDENEEPMDLPPDFSSFHIFPSGLHFLASPPASNTIVGGPWRWMAKRNFLLQHNLQFSTEMVLCEDLVFYKRMLLEAGKVGKIYTIVYYYVQHPTSLAHLRGLKKLNENFEQDLYKYVEISAYTRKKMECTEIEHKKAVMVMRQGETLYIHQILTSLFKTGTLSDTISMIKKLKDIQAYPFKNIDNTYRYRRLLMDSEWIWIALCACIAIIPKSVRRKYFFNK